MSVVIKGMKMPNNCDECPCYYETEGAWRNECEVLGKEYIASDNRPEWCPLVELPPHGRLIDADALKAVVCEALKKALDNDSVNLFGAVLAEFVARGFTDEIENAPTIIEAEVSE